jgi:hypothetical protein
MAFMDYLKTLLLFIAFYAVSLPLYCQVNDNILWASVKFNKKINSITSWSLAPITRYDQNVSNYANTSVDVSLRRKMNDSFYAQLLSRTWFIPNGANRQFMWLDVNHTTSIHGIKLSNNIRYHYAIDIEDRNDPDYIRWKVTASIPGIGRIEPSFSIEPWWRMNGFTEIQRIRFEPGVSIDFLENMKFIFVFRREKSINIKPQKIFNMYVTTISYSLT